VLLYTAVAIILIFPFDIFYLSTRFFLLRTLWRIVFPFQAIAFADFFVADILTSMSKVFSDLERSVCRMVHRQDTREKTSLLNALKYSTAVPVIFLSALKYHVFPDNWINFYRPLWLLSSFLNSLYSFYWDVTRDWDLSCFTRIFKFTKPHIVSQLIYGQKWIYFWVIGSNLILRCTWTYKLSAHLRHNHLTVFAITTLEIFRRFQWAFFRVENEWNKMSSKQNIQMGEISGEEVKLLNSNNHNV
nr:SPX and EXS domain-containing protein 1 isoform X1 [Tanacetum cinerariifolium]